MKIRFTLLLLLSSLVGVAQWKGFQSVTSYTVSDVPNLIHTKDITGDGMADLTVLYSANKQSWAVLSGKGNGLFRALRSFSKEENYQLSDIGDLNKDGYPDMVISSYWNNGFVIWFGQSSGVLRKGPYMHTGTHGRAVKCVDINKDGQLDIVSTTSGSGNAISLHVFINKGDGTFHPKQSFPSVLDTCKDIFITDKNNDGLWDIAVSSSFPWVLVYEQDAQGGFMPTYHPAFQIARPAFADVNKDGREDLILLYASFDNLPNTDSLVIKLNTGKDYFTPSIRIAAFENKNIRPYYLRTADLNKDGFTDLVFSHTTSIGEPTDSLFYMLGKGNVQFEAPVAVKTTAAIASVTLADLNADGWVDLVVGCADKSINVMLNDNRESEEGVKTFKVYPNPATAAFCVEVPVKSTYRLFIYNAAGQQVHEQMLSDAKTRVYIPGLVSGFYTVKLKGQELEAIQTLLIQK